MFLDADDLADPRRLERTRAAFCSGSDVNVVYSSHDFIDEYGHPIPLDSLAPTVREAVDGHRNNPVDGEDAWIQIATRKNYANLLPVQRCARLWLWPSPLKSQNE